MEVETNGHRATIIIQSREEAVTFGYAVSQANWERTRKLPLANRFLDSRRTRLVRRLGEQVSDMSERSREIPLDAHESEIAISALKNFVRPELVDHPTDLISPESVAFLPSAEAILRHLGSEGAS